MKAIDWLYSNDVSASYDFSHVRFATLIIGVLFRFRYLSCALSAEAHRVPMRDIWHVGGDRGVYAMAGRNVVSDRHNGAVHADGVVHTTRFDQFHVSIGRFHGNRSCARR
jgi:hypothetical protein